MMLYVFYLSNRFTASQTVRQAASFASALQRGVMQIVIK